MVGAHWSVTGKDRSIVIREFIEIHSITISHPVF